MAKYLSGAIIRSAHEIGRDFAGWRKILSLTAAQVADRADIRRDTLRKLEHCDPTVSFRREARKPWHHPGRAVPQDRRGPRVGLPHVVRQRRANFAPVAHILDELGITCWAASRTDATEIGLIMTQSLLIEFIEINRNL